MPFQAHLNKVARQLDECHVRPCNLQPEQRDLTPVLRRPVEPSGAKRTARGARGCLWPIDTILLEALKGDLTGKHSIRINDQWRVVFRWTDAGPEDVEMVDYHWCRSN